jgi:hypothetical protein
MPLSPNLRILMRIPPSNLLDSITPTRRAIMRRGHVPLLIPKESPLAHNLISKITLALQEFHADQLLEEMKLIRGEGIRKEKDLRTRSGTANSCMRVYSLLD